MKAGKLLWKLCIIQSFKNAAHFRNVTASQIYFQNLYTIAQFNDSCEAVLL